MSIAVHTGIAYLIYIIGIIVQHGISSLTRLMPGEHDKKADSEY